MEAILEKGIFYDRRVVTYKWLSWKSGGHPNTAKEYLRQFLVKQEADNVTGHSVTTGIGDESYRVILTVGEARKKFSSVTGVHLYSVCPANLPDVAEHMRREAIVKPGESPIERRRVAHAKPEKLPIKVQSEVKVHPSVQSAVKVRPSVQPAVKVHTSVQPAVEVRPSVQSAVKVHPSVQPAVKVRPSVQSAVKVHPLVQPAVKVHPSVQPAVNVRPSVQSAVKVHPSVQPAVKEASEEEQPDVAFTEKAKQVSPAEQNKRKRSEEDASNSMDLEGPDCKMEHKRKVMKAVKETYKDEEGFLVTKTVKQLVSESDDEEPLPIVKEEEKKKMKQQTLFSFLKKK